MDGPVDRDPCGCAAGRAMAILGERWTFLILHEAFHGVRRFSEMQRNLGIARNILSARLQLLVRTGILEKHRYQAGQERFEYRLSATGRALYPAVVAITPVGRAAPRRRATGRTPCCATAAASRPTRSWSAPTAARSSTRAP